MDQNNSDKRPTAMHNGNADHDDPFLLLRQTQYPYVGPELPHPADYLLPDESVDAALDQQISRLLTSYSVDINHGFLPAVDPLVELPLDGKFGPWELIMKDFSHYLYAKMIRSVILSRLSVIEIDHDDLTDEREFRRAFFVLAMLSHAFVWGEQPVSTSIPACLAVPWVELSKRACLPPIITHSLTALANWRRFDLEKPIELGNIAILHGFLSGVDEANFYLVTIELEARGAKAVRHMIRAQYFASKQMIKELTEELRSIETVQKSVLVTLTKMFTEVDPYIFYNRIRHFLAGWKGNALLPDGLLYEGVSETRQFLHGASAAQSSLIAAFDVFLDVKHTREQTHEFMNEMRNYMPMKHRRFLEILGASRYNVHHWVKTLAASTTDAEHVELLSAYNSCVDQLIAFRNKHIQVVTLYILTQMRKTGHKNHGDDDEHDGTSASARGTGGTVLMPFLKACRDETKAKRLN